MKRSLIVIMFVLLLSSCIKEDTAELVFDVTDLNSLNYSSEYLYYNITYEDVTYESINGLSSSLLLIDITTYPQEADCIYKEAEFSIVSVIYGEFDNEITTLKYPVEYYNEEINELRGYPDIEDGLYLMFLEENDNNEYRITNNYNGLININNHEMYNADIKIKTILNYYILENAFVTTNMVKSLHMSNNSYVDIVFDTLALGTIDDSVYTFTYYHDQELNKYYILINGILFTT